MMMQRILACVIAALLASPAMAQLSPEPWESAVELPKGPILVPGPVPATAPGQSIIPVDPDQWHVYHLINAPIVAPGAVVGRGLEQQPTYAHLVELRVNNTTVLVDPAKNYTDKPWGGLDEDHFLAEAQRMAAPIAAERVRVVRNPRAELLREREQPIRPRAILHRPLAPQPDGPMPSVPDQPEPTGVQVVSNR